MEDSAHLSNDSSPYKVINVYEELVYDNVSAMMKHIDMCTCSKCFSDACALVLNQVPPHYVTTRKGELLSQLPKLQVDTQIDLTVKVMQALNKVKDSPRH